MECEQDLLGSAVHTLQLWQWPPLSVLSLTSVTIFPLGRCEALKLLTEVEDGASLHPCAQRSVALRESGPPTDHRPHCHCSWCVLARPRISNVSLMFRSLVLGLTIAWFVIYYVVLVRFKFFRELMGIEEKPKRKSKKSI